MEKSKKDIAFDKERAQYRRKIRELEFLLKDKDKTIGILESLLETKTSRVNELEDWVSRLLEYTEMSEDDLKEFINSEKEKNRLVNNMNSVVEIMGRFIPGGL